MWSRLHNIARTAVSRQTNAVRFTSTYPPSLLSLKVAKIVDIKDHPDAEKLYISQVQHDINHEDGRTNSDGIIQICSGLKPYIDKSQLLNRKIVIMANLKASKMRGAISQAMLLAASSPMEDTTQELGKVELVTPPFSSQIGDVLKFETFTDAEPAVKLKSKPLADILSKLATDERCHVVYDKQYKLTNAQGDPCTVDTLKDAPVR